MIVNSTQLEKAADTLRRRKCRRRIPAIDMEVTASQMAAAAKILREAEPSVCNGSVQERPGFLERAVQELPEVLVFQVGILSSTLYRIDRRGRIEEVAE